MNVLDVSHLAKIFGPAKGGFTAVDDISFSVGEGEIVGLLGPNGAGKTTTIQMLLGLIIPTAGSISYFGKPFEEHREYCLSRINFASAYAHLQSRLSVRQNLIIYAGLYSVPDATTRIAELLQLLEIEQLADKLFWHLSSGQKTRVVLAKALLNRPKLILMDEPTASLDPDIASKVVDLVRSLQQKEHVSLLYTSHNMDEIERLCDRVIFLHHGKIVAEDTPLGLTKRVGEATLIVTFEAKQALVSAYLKKHHLVHAYPRPERVVITLPESEIPRVLFGLGEVGVWVTEMAIEKPSLEDVFLSIAKGTL